MSRIETLPADQRAVLQLLLRRGSRYEELSGLLSIDEGEVRRRAHGALQALGPGDTPGLTAERRAQIADYLLGQQSGEQRAATHGFLEGSAGGRSWARLVAGELRDIAGDRLPDVPDDGREDGAGPMPVSAEPTVDPFGAESRTNPGAGRPARPRTSRRGGAFLLGGVLLAGVAVVLLLVLRGGNGGSSTSTTKAADTTSTTQTRPQVVAQANLVPPSSRKGSKALGVVIVQRVGGQQQIVAAAQGLTRPKNGGYGIWLYSNPGKEKWLGFFASQDKQGRLLARGALKEPISGYREILVTREAKGNPPTPGAIFLRGPVQVTNGSGG